MNRLTTISMIVLAVAVTSFTPAHAQTSKSEFDNIIVENAKVPSAKLKGTLKESDVNIRAVRSFRKSFPDVADAIWNEMNGEYFVHFTKSGVRQKIAFRKNGEFGYSIKMYHSNQIPERLRRDVKNNYFDYEITNAQEVTTGNDKIYYVQLSAKNVAKTLRIENGDLVELQNLRDRP